MDKLKSTGWDLFDILGGLDNKTGGFNWIATNLIDLGISGGRIFTLGAPNISLGDLQDQERSNGGINHNHLLVRLAFSQDGQHHA